MQYFQRPVEEAKLKELIINKPDGKNIICLEGVIGIGKSTFIAHTIAAMNFPVYKIDAETSVAFKVKLQRCWKLAEVEDLLKEELGFDSQKPGILFVDNAVENNKMFKLADEINQKWRNTTVILCDFALMRLFDKHQPFPRHLVHHFVLKPLKFWDFLTVIGKGEYVELLRSFNHIVPASDHFKLVEHLETFLKVGGMPRAVEAYLHNRDYKAVHMAVFDELSKFFVENFPKRQQKLAALCLRSLAKTTGRRSVNKYNIGLVLRKPSEDTRKIFEQFQQWHIAAKVARELNHECPSFTHVRRYLFDTGLLYSLQEEEVISFEKILNVDVSDQSEMNGILQNFTFIELDLTSDLVHSWSDESQARIIPFILQNGGLSLPLECRPTTRITKHAYIYLHRYLKVKDLKTGVILSMAPYGKSAPPRGKKIIELPIYEVCNLREIIIEEERRFLQTSYSGSVLEIQRKRTLPGVA